MNKQSSYSTPFGAFTSLMDQVREASALPSTTHGEAVRAEELLTSAKVLLTKAVGELNAAYMLTSERDILDIHNGAVDLLSDLKVPLAAIGDEIARKEG